jgi:hypothetical protein
MPPEEPSFFMARQDIGFASRHANMAVNIAQAGANEAMAQWNVYAASEYLFSNLSAAALPPEERYVDA